MSAGSVGAGGSKGRREQTAIRCPGKKTVEKKVNMATDITAVLWRDD